MAPLLEVRGSDLISSGISSTTQAELCLSPPSLVQRTLCVCLVQGMVHRPMDQVQEGSNYNTLTDFRPSRVTAGD